MSVITRIMAALIGCLFFLPITVQALVVTPAATDFVLEAGQEGTVEMLVANDGAEEASYELLVRKVVIDAERQITLEELTVVEEGWFTLSSDYIDVQPNEAQVVHVAINPSDSLSSGTYTYAVQVTELLQETGQIHATPSILSLLFITIGAPDAKAELLDFSILNEQSNTLPLSFTFTVRNEGERIVQPEGSMQIYNVFGKVVRQVPLNVDGKRILSGEERTLMVQWGRGESPQSFVQTLYAQVSQFAIGPFTARLMLTPWEGAEPLIQEVTLFVFPWQLVSVFLVVIIGIVVLARLKR